LRRSGGFIFLTRASGGGRGVTGNTQIPDFVFVVCNERTSESTRDLDGESLTVPKRLEANSVIESFGGQQDNVVFMGRRSFRMEIAGGPGVNELAIPLNAASTPTARIFASDRQQGLEQMWLAGSRRGSTTAKTVVLCASAFAFGILLTWTFNRWASVERARAAATVAAATAAAAPAPSPASEAVIVQLPPATAMAQHPLDEPTAVEQAILAKTLSALGDSRTRPPRRAVARIGRPAVVHAPKPNRTAAASASVARDSDADAPAKPWVDPFAE
jgi:hypothetical protein